MIYDSVFVAYFGYPESLESKRTIVVERIKNTDMNTSSVKKD